MIENKRDLKKFINEELNFLKHKWIVYIPIDYNEGQIVAKYLRRLRISEYHCNCKHKFRKKISLIMLERMQCRYGIHIPINTFDMGLSIAHIGTIVVNTKARIGKNCRIHVGVVIGDSKGDVPIIGDNVYLGPGAKVFGGVHIASNIKIGANAVVNKSCETEGAVLVGIPAKNVIK